MKKELVSGDILKQLDILSQEASGWAKESEKALQDFDPNKESRNNSVKKRIESRNFFKYQPLP